ncbi:MAG: mgtE intracellular domain protein [Bacillales bacterium]|nr:mgtE intracellular domain protein [Bacillales bacterium]
MQNKRMASYIITGVITVGLLGGTIIPVFAASEAQTSKTVEKKYKFEQNLNAETRSKIKAIMDDAETQLKTLGVEMPQRGRKAQFKSLDVATKEKVKVIMDKKRVGTITHEEAQKQLKDIGVEMPVRGEKADPFANLDSETKAKAQSIMENARKEISKLGVNLPVRGGRHMEARGKNTIQ